MSDLTQLTIHETKDLLQTKKVSAVEVTQSYLNRIKKLDSKLDCYLHVASESALAQAKACDQAIQKGQKTHPLMGIPLGPKDIFLVEGMPVTCASKILEGYHPPYNSTVIDHLLNQQSVILGKTTMDEFAMGSSNENSAFKISKNPWDVLRVTGGSSGGSASAVAADLCAASLGTDTGGSIRQPASLCGIVGLKPTYGRVSRYGVIAFASSLDQVGPMTKDVEDCALLLSAISKHDPKDSTSIDKPNIDYTKFLNQSIKGLKVGVPKELFVEGLDDDVRNAVNKAIDQLKNLGAIVDEVSLPHTDYAPAAYYIIAPAEASSNLARYDGVRFGFRAKANNLEEMYVNTKSQGFGAEVKRRIMLGTYVLSAGYYDAYYRKAQRTRTVILQDFQKAFEKFDVLVSPTSPTTAFKIGEKSSDPIKMYLSDVCTISTNLAGLPGISIPCGFDSQNLPIGFQIIGKAFDEGTLLKVAHAYEQATDWHLKKPDLI